ncbi:thiolase-like protein [Pelagophyceae sp. CCMP2097]|nr:thiolase-like protein [Pelagophyceae sp. CCMP2097]|mmetsp:Transcript_9194/g.30401  ORF Transcript_9194/g.30401 Transcript_9194/m.30401 type:complete len:437 (-) Transcript_9194:119-1429(-)
MFWAICTALALSCAAALAPPQHQRRLARGGAQPSSASQRSLALRQGSAAAHGPTPRGAFGARAGGAGGCTALRSTAEAEAVAAPKLQGNPKRGLLQATPIGVGSCTPDQLLTNDQLAEFIETSDEWISQRTGISKRRLLPPNSSLQALATTAAQRALTNSGIDASEIQLVIVATSSPDDLFGDASSVAAAIGASNAVAFDLTAACSGFLFGMVTAAQFMESGCYDTALVVGADALSRWVDWDDRNTAILFGDGAGAVVLRSSSGEGAGGKALAPGLLGFELRSNGLDNKYLQLPYCGVARPLATAQGHDVTTGGYSAITMNGAEVYKFATREVPKILEQAMANAEITVDQVDWLLLHQANIRIMETVAKRLGIPLEKIITNLADHGNTSAGSIPLALDAAVRSGKVKNGDVVACAGFGAGLSWGAAIIRWGGDSTE